MRWLVWVALVSLGCAEDLIASERTESPDDDGDGWTVEDGDCDDSNPAANPGASDGCFDGSPKDLDCSGRICIMGVDEFFTTTICLDADQDGYGGSAPVTIGMCDEIPEGMIECVQWDDCDDSDPSIHPVVAELCNGVDDDCDGEIDETCP